VNASIRPLVPERALTRPWLEGVFGLLLVGVLLLSTLDDASLAPVGRALILGCFALLTIINVGAAVGVYIAAALLLSAHASQGQISWVERPDNIALAFLTLYLFAGRCFTRSAGRFGRTGVAIALLLATTFIHLVMLVGVDWFWTSWFSRMFAIPLSLFVLLRRAALTLREVRALLLIVAALGVYLAAVTVLEALGWYEVIIPPWLGDPALNPYFGSARIGGLAMQPEWNALEISLALCVLLLRLDPRVSRMRVGWLAGAGLCVMAVFLTYTRGAWLALIMGGVPLFWARSAARGVTFRRRAFFVAGVIAFVALVLFSPSELLRARVSDSDNVYFRFNVWVAGVGMLRAYPLFGVGFGHFALHLAAYLRDLVWIPSVNISNGGTIAHNTFLSVAAELGLVGLTLYVFVIRGVFKSAAAGARAAWGTRGMTWVAGFSLVYFVNAQFITAHELIPNLLYFLILGAIAGMRLPDGGNVAHPAGAARRDTSGE
jgi:O-antigen ligase